MRFFINSRCRRALVIPGQGFISHCSAAPKERPPLSSMHLHLPINLFALLTFSLSSAALSSAALPNSHKTRFKLSSLRNTFPWSNPSKRSGDGINLNPNGSTFLWLPQDEYSGESFFEYVFSLRFHAK